MDVSAINVVELVPHGPEAVIIDRLLVYAPQGSTAFVRIKPDSAFVDKTGVPAWVGIEYMAQTIAAHVGYEARLRGEAPSVGFLLGTRAYNCAVSEFPVGSELRIAIEPSYMESGFGAFNCSIEMARTVATAVVNTYRPNGAIEVEPGSQ